MKDMESIKKMRGRDEDRVGLRGVAGQDASATRDCFVRGDNK